MARTKSKRLPARDRILSAASRLFYEEGTQNVGIDRIISESGVAKMSLYNHFKSKDALIAAWLEQRDQEWRAFFKAELDAIATTPKERLLGIFDVLQAWFTEPDFRGCAFINSSVELVKTEHPGYQVALEHKQALAETVSALVAEINVESPEDLSEQILLLIEGSIVRAMMMKQADVAQVAKQAVTILLSHSGGSDRSES